MENSYVGRSREAKSIGLFDLSLEQDDACIISKHLGYFIKSLKF